MNYSSKLTSQHKTTIPREIRKHLHLKIGDEIFYELLPDSTVIIRKTSSLDLEYHKALNAILNEWASEEDEQSFKNL